MAIQYKNGVWVWDQYNNGVMFQTKDALQKMVASTTHISVASGSISGRKNMEAEIRLFDSVDAYNQAKFRRNFQIKVKSKETAVVSIQDVKDVAIYTSKFTDITPEFISYFHTVAMDKFLRSMIVYFQYYLQLWSKILIRRKEASRKLRQPIVTVLENEVSDNLADLRSMVSRDYASILLGLSDAKKFHHMSNKNNDSLSDRDRRLFETLCFMTIKVVWIALFRKNLSLIEKETHRLLRTTNYSPIEHTGKPMFITDQYEQRMLLGKAFRNEKKLLHRSPIIQENIFCDHDYRMMAIGLRHVYPIDERNRYLEIAYAAPEELLVPSGIAVGVLGVEKKYLDAMLKPKEISTTVKRTSVMKIGDFNLPLKCNYAAVPNYNICLTERLCKFQESQTKKDLRQEQCQKWRTYFMNGQVSELDNASAPTIKTSTAPSYILDYEDI